MIPSPILNAGWLQVGVSAFTMHDQAIPPVLPVAPLFPGVPGLIEGPAFLGWPPGFLVHKKELSVLVDGNPGIKNGHDVGYLIPHFAIPMNALCAVNTIFSKHKVMMPVSNVLLKGSPAGTYMAFLLGLICCNPVSLPSGVVMLLKCTVWTSLTLIDLLKGLAYIAIDMAFDLLWNKLFKGKSPPFKIPTPSWLKGPSKQLLQSLGLYPALKRIGLVGLKDGAGVFCQFLFTKTRNKLHEHIIKSWLVGSFVKGLPRGKVGVGRGDILSAKWFGPYW